MNVRVLIRKKSEDVPDEFLFSVLSNTLGISEDEFNRIKSQDGSVSLYVRDPEAVIKLQRVADKYSFFVDILFNEEGEDEPNAVSLTSEAVRSNWGLVLSWSTVMFLLSVLSLIPVLGLLASVFMNVFINSFVLRVAQGIEELTKERVRESISTMKLSEVFRFFGAGFGVWLGFLGVYLVFIVLFVGVTFLLGGIGLLSDLFTYGRISEGTASSVLAVVVLFIVVAMWLLYSLPLVFSRVIRREPDRFDSSLLAVFSIFSPSFVKESFSGTYVGIGGLWSLIFTVGIIGVSITIALLITIPLAFLISYWINIFLSISSLLYIKKS